ncbi:hypothetical protein evm_011228 [Chilo suppressalis]|nr:hypothetical protein evm_011228 [Chilo suppressalis]
MPPLQKAEAEEERASALRDQVDSRKAALEEYVQKTLRDLAEKGIQSSSVDTSSDTSTECLLQLLQQCEPETANAIKETVERHKREVSELEQELQCRASMVASHRGKVERLQAELALLHTQQLGLRHALAADLSARPECGEFSPIEGVKRSKSELVLRRAPREEVLDPLSADERDDYQAKKMSLSLSLDPLASPNTAINTEEFHTASCSSPKPFPGSEGIASPSTGAGTTTLPSPEGTAEDRPAPPPPDFRLGPGDADDSDISSADDCRQSRVVEGQSSSSVERSPEERHQRAKYRRKISSEAKAGRRQVTEAEALRAMQRLCSRIAAQKMLVISSLENDCSKDDLNRQIAVLQELQKKYVRLEMALQYSFFDTQPAVRPVMVTPIQETPSLTLSESDMHVATDDTTPQTLKEQDMEGSDNVSTSNDELPTDRDEPWHPLREPLVHDPGSPVLADTHILPDPRITAGLLHPIDFSQVISIPGWVTRGAGAGTHHEYEVRVTLPDARYLLLRRYRRFRDLYLAMRRLYPPEVATIPFPARQLWSSEAVARARRPQLEAFLRRLLSTCAANSRCPLHRAPLNKDTLQAFSPFFRKGVFESGKCGTG